MKCIKCDQDILDGEEVYQLEHGTIAKDDMGGLGFEPAKSFPQLGYYHVKCDKKKMVGIHVSVDPYIFEEFR